MIPSFEDKSELFKWLHANKSALIAQKKSAIKCPEGLTFGKDNDEDPLCGNCPNDLWEKCADERELMYK